MNRVPVVSKEGKPLMPTKPSRVPRWIKEGKAVGKWSDLGVYYVQLTTPPSAEEVQPIAVGVDPGKSYSGVGVQSAKCTLLQLHLILPFGRVKKRMETRAMLRRSRRSRRINRDVPFKQRNHRQCRFDNRKQCKLPPSIKASRQLELRVVKELAAIFPVAAIEYERVRADIDQTKRKRAKSGKGFSPVMTGQNWAISQMEKIVPVYVRHGWQKNGNGTSQLRTQLGLEKDKVNKSIAKPETHAVDGVTLACGYFVKYVPFIGSNSRGYTHKGSVNVTPSPFKIITRPGAVQRGKEYGFFRRQLHFEVPDKSGTRKRKGGTITPFGLRIGDLVRAEKAGKVYIGYVSGFTDTERSKKVSVCDYTWKRIGQFAPSKVELIRRNNGLCVA
ncbi:MAG: RRXRR domain-containing protein [Coleofasciculus sp. B1-GNL1-01]|uniref:RRXRR domain-containing protein n=1 Tax=Coleofasciculus sp. B1-GNL1-01 TaxID=3068484 RepID=UPI0033050CF2